VKDLAQREWGGGIPAGRQQRDGAIRPRLTVDEKKARKRAYMKAYLAKRAAKLGRDDSGKGIPASKFKKFLVKGPISQGGTGED
jgi:hypothetical protein